MQPDLVNAQDISFKKEQYSAYENIVRDDKSY